MNAISLWQPYASALFLYGGDGLALKPDETRSWQLPPKLVGQEIAIHAAKRDTKDLRDLWKKIVMEDDFAYAAFLSRDQQVYHNLPRGCIIGKIVFGQSHYTNATSHLRTERQRRFGDYAPNRFAWPVESRVLFSRPIPCVGRQGFFNWEPPVA